MAKYANNYMIGLLACGFICEGDAMEESLKRELKVFAAILFVFLVFYWLPIESARLQGAIIAAFELAKWYAREHVLLCLVPAFFIAGTIAVFIKKEAVLKYLGPDANKFLAYGISSISGAILAVCSCTVLPLFAGIYRGGAGLGPAVAFLYSGPAINVLAIILTARVLGLELGLARAIGAISFSVIIGLIMEVLFPEEKNREAAMGFLIPQSEDAGSAEGDSFRMFWSALLFLSMVAILVFVNWARPSEPTSSLWQWFYDHKWSISSLFGLVFAISYARVLDIRFWKILTGIAIVGLVWLLTRNVLISFVVSIGLVVIISLLEPNQIGREWVEQSWYFAKLILPLLFVGVLVAGFLLGKMDERGIIPQQWIASAVGGNSLRANFIASVVGAFMYFATLTEIPILQGLINAGMGKGPALALLLAGPALSLPNMLVIRTVLGTKKTVTYVGLVVIFSTIAGILYGAFVGQV